MITSTYGVKLPEDGDNGSIVFPALNTNATLFRDHTHNGTNSSQIASTALTKGSVSITTGDWSANGSGLGFEYTFSLPGSYTLANCVMVFKVKDGANQHKIIHPTIIPNSATNIKVLVNTSMNVDVLFI